MNFLYMTHYSLLSLRNTREHFSSMLGGHLKQQNQKKHKNAKSIALNRRRERHCLHYELKQECRILPCWPQLGTCLLSNSIFSQPCAYPKMVRNVLWVLILMPQIIVVSKWTYNMESVNNEDWPYMHTCILYFGKTSFVHSPLDCQRGGWSSGPCILEVFPY